MECESYCNKTVLKKQTKNNTSMTAVTTVIVILKVLVHIIKLGEKEV